jgi:hypothetical protein
MSVGTFDDCFGHDTHTLASALMLVRSPDKCFASAARRVAKT